MQDLYGTLSGIFTAISMVLLIAIAVWAWSGRRRTSFEASAQMPLEEDLGISTSGNKERTP